MATNKPKGQHFLPTFLLKGWVDQTQGRYSTYLYSARDGAPVLRNIKKFAKGHYYYGDPDETGVETALSSAENRFAAVLDRVRADNELHPDRLETLCALIVNLAIRTDHFRGGFGDETERILDVVADVFTGDRGWDIFADFLGDQPHLVGDAIREAGATIPALRLLHPEVRLTLERSLETIAPQFIEQHKRELPNWAKGLMGALREHVDLRKVLKDAHIKALKHRKSKARLRAPS